MRITLPNTKFVLKFSMLCAMTVSTPAMAAGLHGASLDNVVPYSHMTLISADQDITKGAETFIDSMGQRAIGFLGNDGLSKSQKAANFRDLLKDSFDLKTIGRFSLGKYWNSANEAQKAEYQNLFEDLVVNVYSQRFDEYQGQNLKIKKSRAEGKSDVIVNSAIVDNSGKEFKVDWRVRYKNNQYKVVDVIIEGVSMSLTQRSDFSSVIQRGGGDVSVLISHLKAQ